MRKWLICIAMALLSVTSVQGKYEGQPKEQLEENESYTSGLTIERKYKVHWANKYSTPSFCIEFGENKRIMVSYCNYSYNGDERHGILVYIGETGDKKESKYGLWKLGTTPTDQWVDEKIKISTDGTVSYYQNDKLLKSGNFSGLKLDAIKKCSLQFHPYGWWTGHYHYMDDLTIMSGETVIRDNFNSFNTNIWQTPKNPDGVKVEGGIMKMEQKRTDQDFWLRSKEIILDKKLAANSGKNEAQKASTQPLPKILDYKDYKFLDDEPDYLLYKVNDNFNGYTYCETTKKLYTLENGYDNCKIREYDLSDVLNQKVVERSFTLPFGVDISSMTIDNSPNGKYLALIDKDGKFLHIIDAASGAETAKAKLGKKFPYTDEGKHHFAFQSNDEIIVIGKETALLYNFAQKKAKTLSNGEVSYFRWVDHKGRIQAYVNGNYGTYNIEKGELRDFQAGYRTHDFNNHNFSWVQEKDKKGTTYIDNRTGKTVSEEVANSDGKKYTIANKLIFNPENGAGIAFTSSVWIFWMDNGRLLYVMDKKERNGFHGFRIYNHTLTDNEIEKQKLRVIIDERKDKKLLAEYIKEHPNSQYLPIACQKMWAFLSSPNDFSAEHIAEVQNYIKDYGSMVNVDAAKEELNSLYRKNLGNIEVSDFKAYESYISQFPESPYIDQARAKQKEAYRINYEILCRNTNAQSYLDYAAKYPKSPYADAARERARQILAEEEELKREYDKAMNLFEKEQYAAALPLVQKLANKGNDNMQCILGTMYEGGLAMTKDNAKAVEWYMKASKQGLALAQYKLGYMYDNGWGVKEDDAEAVKWYRKAAEQGNANGQYKLGYMYSNGYGVKEDDAEAVKWYRKSAENGEAAAQNNLGYMYANGYGVKKDDAEAVKWYRKAAENGDAMAQKNLGARYEDGRGVKKDDAEAVKWYRKAANQGNSYAKERLVLLEGPANAVTDLHKWSMGKQVCVRYNGGILLGYVEKFNENRSSAQIKVVAGPSGEYKGQTLKKNGLIWIEKGAGWHLAIEEEISYANSNNKLKEESSGQTTTKTETKTNNCGFKTGDKVYVLYRYSSIFGMKVTDRICGVVIAVDVDDECYYQVLIQSIYDGSFKDPQKAKTRTDNRDFSVGDASWFGAGIVYRDY